MDYSASKDQTLSMMEDSDSKEVNSEESQPLVIQTLKLQKPKSGLLSDSPLKE